MGFLPNWLGPATAPETISPNLCEYLPHPHPPVPPSIYKWNTHTQKLENVIDISQLVGFYRQAFNIEYYGPHIVWIFPGFYDRKWYLRRDVNCTVDEILQVSFESFVYSRERILL